MLCVKRATIELQRSMQGASFTAACFAKSKMLGFGQWWLTRPAVKASAEATSHRFETTKVCFSAKFRVLWLLGARLESWA